MDLGQPARALPLWDDLHTLSVQPDHLCFAQFAAACIHTSDSETATKLIQYVEQVGPLLENRLGSYISLFLTFSSTSNVGGMERVWKQIVQRHIIVDAAGFTRLLKACSNIGELALNIGKAIHTHMEAVKFKKDQQLFASLVYMYIRCGEPEYAVACWQNMQEFPSLDEVSYIIMLDACSAVGPSALTVGESIHKHIAQHQFNIHPSLHISLICMYLLCGADIWVSKTEWSLLVASSLLHIKPERYVQLLTACSSRRSEALDLGNLVYMHLTNNPHWNSNTILFSAVINMLIRCGDLTSAASIFHHKLPSQAPDIVSIYQCIFVACNTTGDWQFGKHVYQALKASGIQSTVKIHASIVSMFTRCCHIDTASKVWEELVPMKPGNIALVTILSACSEVGDSVIGTLVHKYIKASGVQIDCMLGTTLLLMYGRSGQEEMAESVFAWMETTIGVDVTAWSAMISIYGRSGLVEKTKGVLSHMQKSGIHPNIITFSALIHACTHTGQPDDALQYYHIMQEQYSLKPTLLVHNCVVDALSRANRIQQAVNFIKTEVVKPNVVTWKSILGAARLVGNVEFAELAYKKCIELDEKDASVYILMANTYALADQRDKEANIRATMDAKCASRISGKSRITIGDRSHWFVANDNKHPEIKIVDAMWNKLSRELENAGYYPDTSWVCRDGSKELKLALLCRHSEKLAICYGLAKTNPGEPLFITNNLRVCGDCHYATLMISLITKRKIVVRDARRYHHFENGQCSCGGFW